MTSHSEQLQDLAAALAKAQGEFPPIDLDASGQVGQGRYKYATLSHILTSVRPVLVANGLSIVQTCEPASPQTIRLTTTLLHTSGQFLGGTVDMPVTNNTPQAAGSALTYARRYSLSAILGIAADDDDDGQAGSESPKKSAVRPRTGPPAPVAPPQAPAASHGGYGHVTPSTSDNMARKWLWARVREEGGIDSKEAYELLEVESLSTEMPDHQFDAILGFIKLAQVRKQKGIA